MLASLHKHLRHGWLVLCLLTAAASPLLADDAVWDIPSGSLELNSHFSVAMVSADDPDYRGGLPEGQALEEWTGGHLPPNTTGKPVRYVFQASFMISGLAADATPALYMGAAAYPFEVYLNGKFIFKNGRRGAAYNSNHFSGSWCLLSPELFKPDEANRLVIQAWPQSENSPLDTFLLTSYDDAVSRAFWKTFFETNLVQAAGTIALLMGIYFFILIMFGHGLDRRYLYFALLCLSFAAAYVNMIFNFGSNEQLLLEKVSRVSFPLTIIFLALFIVEFTGLIKRRLLVLVIIGPLALVASLAVVFQPDMAGVSAVFGIVMNILITPTLVFGLVLLVIDVVRRHRLDTYLIAAAYLVLIAASLADISFVNSGFPPYMYWVPYGFMGLLFAVFFILAFEQMAVSRLAYNQSAEIKRRAAAQSELLARISESAHELASASDELTLTTAESKSIIEEYRSSNEQIAADVFSRFQEVNDLLGAVNHQLDQSTHQVPEAMRDQAEAVGTVTRAINEINQRFGQVMQHAGDSSGKAKALTTLAQTGTDVIKSSSDAISRVSQESLVLRDILSAIEDIAARTNILSINAAIEAARAGETGKGFKVIAQEINELASQSTNSLGASAERMKQMQDNIVRSTALSKDVGGKLDNIIAETASSAASIASIVGLLEEQKRQSDQIGTQIQRLYDSSRSVLNLVEADQRESQSVSAAIASLQTALGSIGAILDGQQERSQSLTRGIQRLESASLRTQSTVATLLELSRSGS